jgi:hypothetical protein
MKASHESMVLAFIREQASFLGRVPPCSGAIRCVLHHAIRCALHHTTIVHRVHIITVHRVHLSCAHQKHARIGNDVTSKSKNEANCRGVRVSINMPLLITILPHLVTFAFHKAKVKTISIPVNVQNVRVHNILGWHHQIPLQSHKFMRKYILFPSLLHKLLTYLLVDVETHLLLSNHCHIPFQDFLVGDVPSDALRELLEVVEEIVCMAYLLMRMRCLRALCDCS